MVIKSKTKHHSFYWANESPILEFQIMKSWYFQYQLIIIESQKCGKYLKLKDFHPLETIWILMTPDKSGLGSV